MPRNKTAIKHNMNSNGCLKARYQTQIVQGPNK